MGPPTNQNEEAEDGLRVHPQNDGGTPLLERGADGRDFNLRRPLWWLFYLHGGFTLALPTTALMYIINSHLEMPLSLLPTYGAIAFLPFSLKPLFAYLASNQREMQLTLLLLLNGVLFAATSCVPSNGLLLFLALAFGRGITTAWPELLLGLSLVEQAHEHLEVDYERASCEMQAQAATARNLGSTTAHFIALIVFLGRSAQLDKETATVLLVTTCLSSFVAAFIALWFRVGSSSHLPPDEDSISAQTEPTASYLSLDEDEVEDGGENTPSPSHPGILNREAVPVISLQVAVILFALRQPLVQDAGLGSDNILLAIIACSLVVGSFAAMRGCHTSPISFWKSRRLRVGLFLTLRHMIPNAAVLVSSFRYSVFQHAPLLLQLLSLADMVAVTGASWSFGRWLSGFSSGRMIAVLIAATSAIASLASLGHLWFVHVAEATQSIVGQFGVALAMGAVATWASEWSFLPDVVIATVSLKNDNETEIRPPLEASSEPLLASDNVAGTNADRTTGKHQQRRRRGIQYGTLITCIDFGDQVGALVAAALVSALGITRESEWDGLGSYICLCSFFGMLSIPLLVLL